MKRQTGFYGWKLLAAMWVITGVSSGFTYYGGNIMNSHMAVEMNLDRKSLGMAFGTFALCMGLTVPLVGFCVNRWGPRRMLCIGTLLAGLGALAMALLVEDMTGVLLAYGLVMGIGASMSGMLPAQTLVTHWFRQRVALAMTIMLTGTATGGLIAAPLFENVIVAFGGDWRTGWVAMSIACAVSCVVATIFVRDRPADLGQFQDGIVETCAPASAATALQGPTGVYKTREDWPFQDVLRHPAWWLMVLGTVCFLTTFGMMVGHGVVHFKDLGHDAATAALFLALLPLTGLTGKLVVAILGDRVELRFLWGGAMAMMAAGTVVAVTATSTAALFGAAFLVGAGSAAAYPCMITLVANYFGKAAYASLMGVMLLVGALAVAAGPLLAGIVFDRFGTYLLAFYSAAAVCLLGGLMVLFARPPEQRQASPANCPAT